jgi:hypothetical protein
VKQFDGTTIFVNSDLVRAIAEEAGLYGFFGIIVCCLSKVPMSGAIAVQEFNEMVRQLKARGIVPIDGRVRYIGPSLEYSGAAGLVVNYTEG